MIIEVCAESYEYALKAEKAGADRIELCKDLHLDGLTPDYETAKRTIDSLNIPVFILIRPRKGDFIYSKEEFERIKKDENIHTWFARDICHHTDGSNHWNNWLESIASIRGPVHLSIDIDGLDGSLVPATGTPVPGGLTYWHAVQTIETAFENLNVVSADVNEIVPQKDTPLTQFTAAMLVTKIIGCKLNELQNSIRR